MKSAPSGLDRRKGIRLIEIATVCAVLGILASLAIPSVVRMQARSRTDRLLACARTCREELPGWLSNTLTGRPTNPEEAASAVRDDLFRVGDVLKEYARAGNERWQNRGLAGEEPFLVVEPAGTLPVYCRREGRIHLIPVFDASLGGIGATVVVTAREPHGGPNDDGILAVYSVEPGID
jgi:type II secretory pathway pseudopilin PulG